MAQRTRILLLLSHLGGGGAEHVIALLARGLSQEKYEVHLGLVGQSDRSGESLPGWVHVHPLGAGTSSCGRMAPAAPDLAASARGCAHGGSGGQLSGLDAAAAVSDQDVSAGAPECHGDVGDGIWTIAAVHAPALSPALSKLRSGDLPVARHGKRSRREAAEIGEEQIAVLPNPSGSGGNQSGAPRAGERNEARARNSLAVGRLSREKGFDLLLKALAVGAGAISSRSS